jgi:hypothetical protein
MSLAKISNATWWCWRWERRSNANSNLQGGYLQNESLSWLNYPRLPEQQVFQKSYMEKGLKTEKENPHSFRLDSVSFMISLYFAKSLTGASKLFICPKNPPRVPRPLSRRVPCPAQPCSRSLSLRRFEPPVLLCASLRDKRILTSKYCQNRKSQKGISILVIICDCRQ